MKVYISVQSFAKHNNRHTSGTERALLHRIFVPDLGVLSLNYRTALANVDESFSTHERVIID